MKLMIFTPVNKQSCVSLIISQWIIKLRSLGHEIVVVRTEQSIFAGKALKEFGEDILLWTKSRHIKSLLPSIDVCIYNFTDSDALHRGSMEWLSITSGIVCLHNNYHELETILPLASSALIKSKINSQQVLHLCPGPVHEMLATLVNIDEDVSELSSLLVKFMQNAPILQAINYFVNQMSAWDSADLFYDKERFELLSIFQ